MFDTMRKDPSPYHGQVSLAFNGVVVDDFSSL